MFVIVIILNSEK